MAMRLPSINGHTLFTVEQIELIRRLRNSGLTKDQISNAFESLERLDREIGPVYNIPITQVANAVTFQHLQVQASQVANQVATQLAQVAQAAQAAQVTTTKVTSLTPIATSVIGNQPVFPRPIAIAPSALHPILNTQSLLPMSAVAAATSPASSTLSSSSGSSSSNVAVNTACTSSTTTSPTSTDTNTQATAPSAGAAAQKNTHSPNSAFSQQTKNGRKRSLSDEIPAGFIVSTSPTITQDVKPILPIIPPLSTTTTLVTNSSNQSQAAAHEETSAADCNGAETGTFSSTMVGEYKLDGIPEITDNSEEYLNFIAKGERPCCEEIREFVQKYNIRQQQIATLSGISQPYVSRFLRGEFSEMSPRSRRTIMKWFITYKNHPTAIGVCQSYVSRFLRGEVFDMSGRSRQSIIKWYLSYKNNPNSIAPAVNAVLMANGHPPAKKFISALDVNNSEFMNAPRRERFVFRPNHVAILEKCFQEDSYPSYQKREEIARTLNATTEASTGKELEEREIVTAQIISNWFANKRKEMKKIAREAYFKAQGLLAGKNPLMNPELEKDLLWEGLDVSQVPLRPRGRPSGRFFLSMLGGGQEQATDLSINASANSPPQHQPPVVNLSQANNNHVATDLSLGDEATDLSINNNNQAATILEEASDGNMSTPDLQDVELAAVNQAILSLTGQQPISIKMDNKVEEKPTENSQEEEQAEL